MVAFLHERGGYRSDIEGLRAVAVAAVVLFHIDATWLPGGFIGVDIFFVISGFLITAKIYKDCYVGRFDLGEFYKHRIRRIIPALTFVIAVTLLAGQFILVPEDYKRLASAAISAQLSVANIYFTYFLDTSYFAESTALEPLLHLWSLGVEEQFYLFWPLLLVLGLKRVKQQVLVGIVSAAIVLSFLGGQILAVPKPMWAYYMLPTRAGQLLTGALAFLTLQWGAKRMQTRWLSESLPIAGLALIAGSLILLDERSIFPGLNAVPVTLGAALIILGGGVASTVPFAGRLIGLPPFAALGRISYSLYLWHWPVLAFARYLAGHLSLMTKLYALLVMLVLSLFSYYVIEKPFRRDESSFRVIVRKQLLIPSCIILAVALAVIKSSGYGLYMLDAQYMTAVANLPVSQPPNQFPEVCQRPLVSITDFKNDSCRIGSEQEPSILLWGDSHASHYVGMLSEFGDELGFSFRNIAHSACPPILHEPERFVSSVRVKNCRVSGAIVRSQLGSFDKIVLAGHWQVYFRQESAFVDELSNTVARLVGAGKRVLVLGQISHLPSIDRKCAHKALKFRFIDCQSRSVADRREIDAVNGRVREIAVKAGATYYDANNHLCPNGICRGYLENQLVYFDNSHLSHTGSRILGQSVRKDRTSLAPFKNLLNSSPRSPLGNSG